ncbi:MAG: hypothetical protein KDD52_09640, partial [Bdellovibrionales bacterium]|nr:hypothetical protein [Bdellovibrionales bacterium]
TAISMSLQYGVPLKVLISKFSHSRFEPSGMTGNPEIPFAKSVVDYIFRWLASKFLTAEEKTEVGIVDRSATETSSSTTKTQAKEATAVMAGATLDTSAQPWSIQAQEDAPPCPDCGSMTIRSGVCYKCPNCGGTTGCS